MAECINSTYPSAQAGLRGRWRTIGAALHSEVLTAQWTFIGSFGSMHYMPEMKWSEETSADDHAAGYKAHLLPHRLLDRLASLEHIKSNRRDTFVTAYACTGVERHMRLDAEMCAFLDQYMETLAKHAEHWLRRP